MQFIQIANSVYIIGKLSQRTQWAKIMICLSEEQEVLHFVPMIEISCSKLIFYLKNDNEIDSSTTAESTLLLLFEI